MFHFRLTGFVFATFLLALTPAKSDIIYSLDIDHCSGGCGSSPFGSIDISQIGTDLVQMVITLDGGNQLVQTGQPGSTVAFNLIGNPSIAIVSSTLPGWSLDSSTAGSLHFDGFGDFEYSLNCCSGKNGAKNAEADLEVLDLKGTGLTPASFQELSTGGSESAFFAVDILSAQTGKTGPVGTNTPPVSPVPEPASLLLLMTVVGGIAFSLKKRTRA